MVTTTRLLPLVFLSLTLISCAKNKSSLSGQSDDSIFGKGNQNLAPMEKQALQNTANQVAENAPESGPTQFSDDVMKDVKNIQAAERQGQDTTQMRLALMGKMLTECGNEVSKYAPYPGEPLLGNMVYMCSGANIYAAMDQSGQYSQTDKAGIPLGKPTISYKGTYYGSIDGTTVTGTGTGTVTADPSGAGSSTGNWIAYASDGTKGQFQLTCKLTDSPQAASGSCQPSPYQEYCPTAVGTLATSKNPIPRKYSEGMKKLAACYRKAIVLISPVLSNYLNTLSPDQQQALLAALVLN